MGYLLIVFSVALYALDSQATIVCEDVEMDCARLDIERNICTDPLESSVYCAKYCGHCTKTIVVPLCEDNDGGCREMATPDFCSREQGRNMCPKSCNACKVIPSVQTVTSTTSSPVNLPMSAALNVNPIVAFPASLNFDIPDPSCLDIDHNCFFHLHECYSNNVVRMLCQRSCDLCPSAPAPAANGKLFQSYFFKISNISFKIFVKEFSKRDISALKVLAKSIFRVLKKTYLRDYQ
ncbi:uncharacterized protein LOC106062136 [Biomphalaria glabrata]|uniref:Uncharacterized protein LOC106062136 n=1 Tax=Biomphalaria glabrata TaxID=6526 RepID=A0A9W3BGM7_BIOGL|nr:uncharacterized protein LOC106062136 [Biomphalaria glabrata]